MFDNNEMCDGAYCDNKERCARYMGNVDLSKCINPYINFNRKKWDCTYFLKIPNDKYPQK
jgi:hypothetical protein